MGDNLLSKHAKIGFRRQRKKRSPTIGVAMTTILCEKLK